MQFIHKSGKKAIFNGIVAVDENGIPVKALLKKNELRKLYRDNIGYWFKYLGNKYYIDEHEIVPENLYCEIHIEQCLMCARLKSDSNRCFSPIGHRSFKGYTKQNCLFFKKRIINDKKDHESKLS